VPRRDPDVAAARPRSRNNSSRVSKSSQCNDGFLN
jgi:hypothetical protein